MNAKLIKYVMLIMNCLFISCAGETYHIIIEDLPPEEIQVTDTTVYVKLSFRAAVGGATSDGQTRTNDTINLPVGRYVTLYIYSEGETPETGNQLRQDKYTVQTAGYLTPVYQVTPLAEGTYNIYAVS